MPDAGAIITYVGVPLAVLGVLPIIYTTVNSLLTIRSLARRLRENGFTDAATRSSLMSGIVEVYLPRYSIAPLDRDEDDGYWKLNPAPSRLKGGTWTIFNWNCLRTGSRMYRLQYSSDLQLPQAEIDFGELIGFLLDRGAVPDAKGLKMLKTSGLWTPTGTRLLLSPSGTETVLRVAIPDDSDGILSLTLHWKACWDAHQSDNLSPGWIRLKAPQSSVRKPGTAAEHLLDVAAEDRKDQNPLQPPSAIRFGISPTGSAKPFVDATIERESNQPDSSLSLAHLADPDTARWASCIALLIGLSKSLPLYSHGLDAAICDLAKGESMPCGVLVMLDVLNESEAPTWETKYDPAEKLRRMNTNQTAKMRAVMAESHLSPAEAQRSQMARLAEERARATEEFRADCQRDRERAQQRKREAINSPRVGPDVVGKASMKYLVSRNGRPEETSLAQIVESLLWSILLNEVQAMRVVAQLVQWQNWQRRGGMTIDDLDTVMSSPSSLCEAACVLALIRDVSIKGQTSVALDMKDCIQQWKNVRLG